MKKFSLKISLFFTIIFFILVFFNYLFHSSDPQIGTMDEFRNDSAYIKDVPQNIKVCNFGNSHSFYSLNYKSYEKQYVCFNFALPGQELFYDFKILHDYKNNISPNAIIFICISPHSFFGNNNSRNTPTPRRYYHFLEKQSIINFNLETYILVNYFPCLLHNSLYEFISTIFHLNTHRNMWNIITSPELSKIHGKKRYQQFIADNLLSDGTRNIDSNQIDSLYNLIALCKKIKATPILFTPPFLSEFTDNIKQNDPLFFTYFYKYIDIIKTDTGVKYYDYQNDPFFTKNYSLFMNTDHLNIHGAKEFTERLFRDTGIR